MSWLLNPVRWPGLAWGAAALLLLLALWPVSSRADADMVAPRFVTVGDASTVPQSVVSALAEDQQGLLWIGTGAGLVRYDGHGFRQLRIQSQLQKTGALGFVRVLHLARDGRLWVGTESNGLVVVEPRSESLQVYRHDPALPEGMPAGTVRSLAEDAQGGIWIGTIGHGLARLDPASGRFSHIQRAQAASGLKDDRIPALLIDKAGTLWVGTWSGLQRRGMGAERFESMAPELEGQMVASLFQTMEGRIWAGTQQGGLLLLDAQGRSLRLLSRPEEGGGPVHGLMELEDGRVWVARGSGIELRDRDGALLRRIVHARLDPLGLGSNEVRALLLDRAGWVWVGSYGGGLQRHNPQDTGIRVRGPEGRPGSAFEDANARSLLQLDTGQIWVGTGERGLAVLDERLRLIGELQPGQGGFAGRRIGGMAQTRDGRIWLGADTELYELDRQRRVLQRQSLGSGRVRRMLAGADGELWVATQDGLLRLQQGQLRRLALEGGQRLSGDVNALVQDAEGGLWVGTEQGLLRLPPGGAALQRVPARPGAALAPGAVLGLLLDRSGRLWVDTAEGLHRMRSWDGREASFDAVETGFVGRSFGANLLEDGQGRIWSQQFVHDPASGSTHELTPADGADIGTGWFRAYVQLRDGRMLFGGSKGLLVVEPQRYAPWSYEPPLVVSELLVDGQPRGLGELRQGLVLRPGERRFAIEFAALDYSAPQRSSYAYRLQGYESDWISSQANVRVAAYGNLPPGQYTLQVRATNRSGLWSRHELAIPVRVEPAWWQQWWLRALGLLAALAAMVGVVQLRTLVLRRRQAQLEARVRERTAELEAATRALQEASLTDPLTGLRNRRFLDRHIEQDIALALRRYETARRQGESPVEEGDLLFFLVDLDRFKDLNDSRGHAAGDAVLQQMRGRLSQVFRDSDYLLRWGGEEFLIVARETSRRHAVELAERARAAVSDQPFELGGGACVSMSCSIGFVAFPLLSELPRALDWPLTLGLADAALYRANKDGRNTWVGLTELPWCDEYSLRPWLRRAPSEWLDSGELRLLRPAQP